MLTGPSEIRRGWLLIVAAAAGVISSVIVLPYYSIGSLVIPVTAEFGWGRGDFLGAIIWSAIPGALAAPIVGVLTDRYGARRIALIGLAGLSAAILSGAFMTEQLWTLYLCYAAMGILGAGTIPVTWTRAIATNFFRQRGLALGLTLTGTGICAIAAPHYTVWLIGEFGWRAAYVGLALVPLLVAGPIVWLGFRPKEADELESAEAAESQWGLTLAEAVRTYRFWVLVVSVLAVYMAVSGIAPNLQPALIDEGFSAETAATVASILGISIMIGRVAVGFLIDKFWAPGVACAALLLPVIGCYLLLQSPSVALASLAAALIGFAAGAELDLMSFFTARYFGLKHYATIYSIAYLCLAFGSAFAPTLFGRVYDTFQDYDAGFMIAGGLFLLGALIVLLLGRYPQRSAAGASQTP